MNDSSSFDPLDKHIENNFVHNQHNNIESQHQQQTLKPNLTTLPATLQSQLSFEYHDRDGLHISSPPPPNAQTAQTATTVSATSSSTYTATTNTIDAPSATTTTSTSTTVTTTNHFHSIATINDFNSICKLSDSESTISTAIDNNNNNYNSSEQRGSIVSARGERIQKSRIVIRKFQKLDPSELSSTPAPDVKIGQRIAYKEYYGNEFGTIRWIG